MKKYETFRLVIRFLSTDVMTTSGEFEAITDVSEFFGVFSGK